MPIFNCYTAQQIKFLQCQLNAAFHCKLLNYLPSFCFAATICSVHFVAQLQFMPRAAKRENDDEEEEEDGENGQAAKLVMTFKKANTGNGD